MSNNAVQRNETFKQVDYSSSSSRRSNCSKGCGSKKDSEPILTLAASCGELKGRSKEIEQLQKIWERVKQTGRSEHIFIGGSAGTGKTSLVKEALPVSTVTKNGGYFVSGKFDQASNSDPYSALVASFDAICKAVVANDDGKRVRSILMESLSETDLTVFSMLVPSVCSIVDVSDGADPGGRDFNMGQAFIRFKQQCRVFLQSVTARENPLVIFLDDLQFGDAKSMDVIQSLIDSDAIDNLLFIASYRDDHEGPHEDLVSRIKDAEDSLACRASHISIGNLDRTKVNEMVSEMLHLRPEETWELSTICHVKTMGNPFFVGQFLKLLESEKLLEYSHESKAWEWDEVKVQAGTNVSCNILAVITERAKHVEPRVRKVLQVASFLGFIFDTSVLLEVVAPSSPSSEFSSSEADQLRSAFMNTLVLAEKQGFIENGGDIKLCKWTHDKVMQSFQSMIPASERAQLHYDIGEKLRRTYVATRKTPHMFLMVHQLNLGSSCMHSQEEKLRLAVLNLEVGTHNLEKSAFEMAQEYFEKGIELLPDDKWIAHHQLCLQLHSKACEAAYSNGDVAKTMEMANKIIAHGSTVKERFPAYNIKVSVFTSQCMFKESNEAAYAVLNESGVFMPRRPNTLNILMELSKVKKLLKGVDDDYIFSLPSMDEKNTMVLQVMGFIAQNAFFQPDAEILAIACLRGLRHSLLHGKCAYTPQTIALYSIILNAMKKYDKAYRFGVLSIRLQERMRDQRAAARTIVSAYSIHNKNTWNLAGTFERKMQAYQESFDAGDIGWALLLGTSISMFMFSAGVPLAELESKVQTFYGQALEFNATTTMCLFQGIFQAILNLQGNSNNPARMEGEILPDIDRFLQEKEYGVVNTLFVMSYAMIVACIFQDWDAANNYAIQIATNNGEKNTENFPFWDFVSVCSALSAMSSYQRHGRRKDLLLFRKSKTYFKLNLKKGKVSSKLASLIVDAEEATLKGTKEAIRAAYTTATVALEDARYVNKAAIAYERMGDVMVERFSDNRAAFDAYTCAAEKFTEWGATAKVDQLQLKLDTTSSR